ncbi:hypothetical protein FCV63_00830 [Vibrio lentus]|uniref:hypothetical protein n=1 Tax=Vibrio TaxID=662 RepID=UPI0010BE0E11|nr:MULTISPECIES: hypothetical protein [Vibrio]MCC4861769.1 hypothetical protein [Vibrio splendidus]TKF61189.1 hypothetical protein FCV63_00830 [Vibrio lentus]
MDAVPKISDIKNLKDLSTVLVLPLLCACYIYQTEFILSLGSFSFSIDPDNSGFWYYVQIVVIFVGKTVWAAFFSSALYMAVIYAYIYIHQSIIHLIVLLLLTFGFVGVFATDKINTYLSLAPLWYYSCFVVAFFLLSMLEQIDSDT